METNPYSAPSPPSYSPESMGFGHAAVITQGVVTQLAGTKPWVRFMSVMLFIGAGFMVILGIFMGLMGGISSLSGSPAAGAFSGGLGIGIAIVYILMAGIYIYPAVKLWSYASRIGQFVASATAIDLEAALNEQRAFWKFVGIAILVVLALYVVIAIFGVIAMVIAGAAASR